MRITPRVWAPLLIAFLLILAIGGVFLWQIKASVALIETTTNVVKKKSKNFLKPLPFMNRDENVDDAQALMLLRQGEVLLAQSALARAEEKFKGSRESGGGIPALRKLIQVQLQRRKYDEARSSIRDLKKEGVDAEDIFLLEGLLELRSGNRDKARSMFQEEGSSAAGQYGLALIALTNGDHAAAKQLLAQVSQSSDPTLRTYARALLDAYDEFALFPESRESHLETLLSRSLAQVNECELALPLVSGVVDRESEYRDAWIVKGYCEFSTERYPEALVSLESAYNLDPEKPEIQYFLARTHYALGDAKNAATFLQYAIVNGFQPEREARELLAAYAQEVGNTDLALDQYRALTENPNTDINAYEKFISLALTIPSSAEEGYQMASAARAKWPDSGEALALLAEAEAGTGRIGDAKAHVDEALNIDPTNGRALRVAEFLKNVIVQ